MLDPCPVNGPGWRAKAGRGFWNVTGGIPIFRPMATIRQYFDTDFPYTIKLDCRLLPDTLGIEVVMLYDFSAAVSFCSVYIPGRDHALPFFINILKHLQHGTAQVTFTGKILLPRSWEFPGELKVDNTSNFNLLVRFYGDPNWISWKAIPMTKRIFLYSESDLTDDDLLKLATEGLALGHEVQFRSGRHVMERSGSEQPVAFISHDSRDADVARRIAVGLQQMRCSVWYDEFTLRAGGQFTRYHRKGT